MRWIFFYVAILILFSSFSHAALQYLTKYLVPETTFEVVANDFSRDYSTSAAPYDDAVDRDVPLGFNFPFNGTTYSSVNIDSNGILYFGNYNLTEYSNQHLPRNNRAQSIYPYWDDLNMGNYNGHYGRVKYETLGNDSNKHFVVSWESVPHYSRNGSYSFQVVLYEDGAIRFRYLSGSDANGNSNGGATIGVQEDTTHYDEHSYNAQINQNQDILYIPNPISIAGTNPTCATPVHQIALTTYGKNGSHPNNANDFQNIINTYATSSHLHGGGLIDNIHVTQNNNNDPYHAGTDNYYLSMIEGYIYFPETGIYKIGIDGDDAIEVYLDDQLITGWYGGHWYRFHATNIKYVEATQGWHKISYHHEEVAGDDGYHLYWQTPSQSTIDIIPKDYYYHCPPSISKTSCVISDPVNNTSNPKRIPGATIRYAIEVNNNTNMLLSDAIINDSINANLDPSTIRNLQIQDGACDCIGVASANNNGPNGTGNGVNPVKLDYGTVSANSKECGYFEVDIK